MNINLTLFGQMVTFAFFVWFCMKYVWPMIIEAMEERQRTIADGLDAADRAMRDLEDAQSKVDQQMRDAKLQAADIIDQANAVLDGFVLFFRNFDQTVVVKF